MEDYAYKMVEDIFSPYGLPEFLIKKLYEKGLEIFESALAWNYNVALPYIP